MVFDENFTMNNPFEPHVHNPYVYELVTIEISNLKITRTLIHIKLNTFKCEHPSCTKPFKYFCYGDNNLMYLHHILTF
jgi:hypothetical protein